MDSFELKSEEFRAKTLEDPLKNSVAGKAILLRTSGSIECCSDFSAAVVSENGRLQVESDLTGLVENQTGGSHA